MGAPTTIQISKKTHSKLEKLKNKYNTNDMDQTVKKLIEKAENNTISFTGLLSTNGKQVIVTENGIEKIMEKGEPSC